MRLQSSTIDKGAVTFMASSIPTTRVSLWSDVSLRSSIIYLSSIFPLLRVRGWDSLHEHEGLILSLHRFTIKIQCLKEVESLSTAINRFEQHDST